MKFTPRLTRPEAGNKYYIRKVSGGWNPSIAGKPTDPDCDVLANCVGYAVGRFNEIGGYGCCKYLMPVNAERFVNYTGGLQTGTTPKLGAVMVWQKGATLDGSDGAGHVAVVEQIHSDGSITTSESGYNSSAFWTQRRTNANGRWGAGNGYKFLCFIYQPEEQESEPNTATKKSVAEIAAEVWDGKWGNGEDRINRLKAAGYDPNEVQKAVNQRVSGGTANAPTTTTPAKKTVAELAKEVWDGKWGNGEERKNRLTAAGYDYNAVQRKVNELLKK